METCSKCGVDLGFVNDSGHKIRFMCEKCRKEYQAQKRADDLKTLVAEAGIPRQYQTWDAKLGNNALLDWVCANSESSIWLAGKTGICKTRALCRAAVIALWNGIRAETPFACLYAFSPDVFRELGMMMLNDSQEFQRRFNKMKAVSLLILDDVGNEKMTDRGAELLFSLIDFRAREQKRTWITTNSSADQFDRHIPGNQGPALRRRIGETSKQWGGNEKT